MRVFELKDVVALLRSEVSRAGGQSAWAKKTGANRIVVNKILNGYGAPTKTIIKALGLRMVFVFEAGASRPRKGSGARKVPNGPVTRA